MNLMTVTKRGEGHFRSKEKVLAQHHQTLSPRRNSKCCITLQEVKPLCQGSEVHSHKFFNHEIFLHPVSALARMISPKSERIRNSPKADAPNLKLDCPVNKLPLTTFLLRQTDMQLRHFRIIGTFWLC